MKKVYKKEDCYMLDGYIVCDGNVIGPSRSIADAFNSLEYDVQKAKFDKENPEPEVCNRIEFKRKSSFDHGIELEVTTTALDKKVKESMEIVKEIDMECRVSKINEYLDGNKELVAWINSDSIIEADDAVPVDLVELTSDIISWSVEKLIAALSYVNGVEAISEESDE